jgi:hypothetical protein
MAAYSLAEMMSNFSSSLVSLLSGFLVMTEQGDRIWMGLTAVHIPQTNAMTPFPCGAAGPNLHYQGFCYWGTTYKIMTFNLTLGVPQQCHGSSHTFHTFAAN